VKVYRFNISSIILLLVLPVLVLGGCAGTPGGFGSEKLQAPDNSDLSCSYFYFLWGTHAEFEGKYDEAVDAYEKALVCDPGAQYIRHKLPLLHLKKGDTEQAIVLLEKSVNGDPQDSASRMLLARLLVQQKKIKRAIKQYETILGYDPDNEQVLLRIGDLLEQIGEEEARQVAGRIAEALKQSFLIDGHSIVTSTSIGITFASSRTRHADEMVGMADQAMYQAKARQQGSYIIYGKG